MNILVLFTVAFKGANPLSVILLGYTVSTPHTFGNKVTGMMVIMLQSMSHILLLKPVSQPKKIHEPNHKSISERLPGPLTHIDNICNRKK